MNVYICHFLVKVKQKHWMQSTTPESVLWEEQVSGRESFTVLSRACLTPEMGARIFCYGFRTELLIAEISRASLALGRMFKSLLLCPDGASWHPPDSAKEGAAFSAAPVL